MTNYSFSNLREELTGLRCIILKVTVYYIRVYRVGSIRGNDESGGVWRR